MTRREIFSFEMSRFLFFYLVSLINQLYVIYGYYVCVSDAHINTFLTVSNTLIQICVFVVLRFPFKNNSS